MRCWRTFEAKVTYRVRGLPDVKLIFRGAAIRQATFKPLVSFACSLCVPAKEPALPDLNPSQSHVNHAMLTYTETVSQAVDRLVGLEAESSSPILPG